MRSLLYKDTYVCGWRGPFLALTDCESNVALEADMRTSRHR